MKLIQKFTLGLDVYKSESDFTITGFPIQQSTIIDFESAYHFEEFISKHVNCNEVQFDSEYCQVFAYTKTKKRAIKFCKDIESHFAKAKSLLT
jgi:hypothetical protein